VNVPGAPKVGADVTNVTCTDEPTSTPPIVMDWAVASSHGSHEANPGPESGYSGVVNV
jgi:hypothetical protein